MTANRIIDLAERDGVDLSRRRFLSVGAALGGGLLIGFTAGPSIGAAEAAENGREPSRLRPTPSSVSIRTVRSR